MAWRERVALYRYTVIDYSANAAAVSTADRVALETSIGRIRVQKSLARGGWRLCALDKGGEDRGESTG